ncbi:MAG: formate/nitrite transporter family protein, partial [Roseobacter sp.]|nr:formate/nitrite transporter family protein [Roseobacter sp.]
MELHRAGRSANDLVWKFEPCIATTHGWIRQAERDGGKRICTRVWLLVDFTPAKAERVAGLALFGTIQQVCGLTEQIGIFRPDRSIVLNTEKLTASSTVEKEEQKFLEEAASLSPRMIYEVIRRDGEEELARPMRSLVWSGIAAGIMISFSVLGEAIFRTYLPETPSRFLIENLGYSLGFLLVILGRMQLFTENTITTVFPGITNPSISILGRITRLWSVVLAANVVGAFAAALLIVHTPAVPSDLMPA